jgi:ABC-type multidrug transport system fused ATPase/permease subunit
MSLNNWAPELAPDLQFAVEVGHIDYYQVSMLLLGFAWIPIIIWFLYFLGLGNCYRRKQSASWSSREVTSTTRVSYGKRHRYLLDYLTNLPMRASFHRTQKATQYTTLLS